MEEEHPGGGSRLYEGHEVETYLVFSLKSETYEAAGVTLGSRALFLSPHLLFMVSLSFIQAPFKAPTLALF